MKGFKIKDVEDITTVSSNAKNTVNNVNAAGEVFDGNFTGSDVSVAGQSVASTVVTGLESAAVIAPEALPKIASGLGRTNIGLTTWGGINDGIDIYTDYKNPRSKVKASSTLSLGSNIAGGLAGGALVAAGMGATVVGAPVIVALGATSFVLWGASSLIGDISLNDAIVHGLGDILYGGPNADKRNTNHPEEELPEISGSQQNQLMAISKTPSFNYTSHKKDSVAGYNLYQMLDNAEDTISNSTMNGFTVYVMGKTIQPTCMGDEAGIGGGVKSGTVGKEVRATTGAPSILYCGYLSIRAGDECTMNNENVEGEYISLC